MVSGTWASRGGSVPNAVDYGIIEFADQTIGGSTKKIGKVTGFLDFRALSLSPNHAHLLGRPSI